ncbi:MAG TPA: ASKHA domain-containing protein [Beijerinckiaceae bacterium]|nr:ASKHA domain-containing protein [Beijerinckiaceae bacterium]
MREPLVVFSPSGKRGRFPKGTSVLDAARRLGVDLDSVCGGRGICGRCQIEIAQGDFPKHGIVSAPDHASPFAETEARYAEKRGLASGRRLGCQARLSDDLVVDVPAESQLHRQVVRKDAAVRAIAVDPVVRLHYVEVAPPDMDDPASDLTRLRRALREQWGLSETRAEVAVLGGLQRTLREGGFAVTAAIRHGSDLVAVYPGLKERVFGLAVDIGSTTVAAHLCDLFTGEVVASGGVMNPQIRFGEDLMSRVSYVMMHPGGDAELTAALREALDRLAGDLCAQAGIDRGDVVEATAVGNPVMHHLLLGLDPTELGGAPFALALDDARDTPARDLGLTLAAGAFVHTLPCIAGHVGADAAAVVLSEAPHLGDELTLVVDVGTNAEAILGGRGRLLACSSPTGPAFEGAQISSGQRAAPGAIERLRIDRDSFEPRFKVVGCDMWSDEPGFAEAAPGVTGICGSGIVEAIAEMLLAGLLSVDGAIDGAMAGRSPRIVPEGRTFAYVIRDGEPRIAVTQNDVRAIQLAKAALYAGAKLLMDRAGVAAVDRVTLAGAFGSHIDPLYAMVLGLVPDCPLDRIGSAGNAAGTGARIALLDAAARAEIAALVPRIEKVETATEPLFQAHFVAAMAFPHASDPFPNLSAAVALPDRSAPARRPRREGRRPG